MRKYMYVSDTNILLQSAGALGNAEYPFIAIAPKSTLTRNGSTW